MPLTLDQHIYGKTKDKDFSTLAVSREISKENLKVLEKYSLYKLPNSLLYDAEAIKPKKYVYYKLNDESMVLGSGVDVGKDEFGRVGNFLFHNLIFKIKEFEKLRLTPISLIRYFEENSIFQSEPFYEGQIPSIDLEIADSHQKEGSYLNMLENKTDLLSLLLYACFNHKEIAAPIYITGDKDRIFEFLDNLFFILPKKVWVDLSFNTFWYEDFKLPGLFLCCTSTKSSEIRPPDYSLKIDLYTELYDSKIEILDKVKYDYAKFIADKALSDKQSLSILYSLQELSMGHNWRKFIESYKNSPQDIKKVIYNHNKEDILTEISQGNIGLFIVLKEVISENDRDRVFRSKVLINRLLEHHDEILIRDFVGWFYDLSMAREKRDFYPIFISDPKLLNPLLEKIKEEKMETNKGIEIVQGLIENYSEKKEDEKYDEAIEERLLNALCETLESRSNMDMSDILKAIKKLPLPKNPKLLLIRALIKYKLGDSSELISLIKEEKYQSLIYEILNEGTKVINWDKYKRITIGKEQKKSLFGLFK